METDLSEYHKGTDGLYYADYIAPNKAETFIGKLVSTEWWHHRGQFALICNFRTEDRRRLPYSLFKNIPVFTWTKIRKCEFQNSGERHSLAV